MITYQNVNGLQGVNDYQSVTGLLNVGDYQSVKDYRNMVNNSHNYNIDGKKVHLL